jgi:nicotinamidase-related amidase
MDQRTTRTGLDALLTPENSLLLLIDHQPFQFANLNSHEPTMIVNNVVGLAKAAKVFDVPTILTTVVEERGGYLIKGIQDVFPEQKPIDRTLINTWQDERVVAEVKKSGRSQIIMAGLWTEICVAMPAIQAIGEGYEVFVVTDACGGASTEAHDMAVRRMVGGRRRPGHLDGAHGRVAARLGARGERHGYRGRARRARRRHRRRLCLGDAAPR